MQGKDTRCVIQDAYLIFFKGLFNSRKFVFISG